MNSVMGYSVQHQKLITIDTGHFHPTESAADKVSSMLLFVPESDAPRKPSGTLGF